MKKVRHLCWWRSGTDQCLILTPCCHCAESEMPRSVTVRQGLFPMWKGQGPSIKKPQKFPALDEVLGEHDVTQSDLMHIGQTFFLISLLREYMSTAPVQHPSQISSYTEFPAPPLRISTWISIIVALVSKCGRLSLRKCHKSKVAQEIANFGWQIAEGSQVMKFTS